MISCCVVVHELLKVDTSFWMCNCGFPHWFEIDRKTIFVYFYASYLLFIYCLPFLFVPFNSSKNLFSSNSTVTNNQFSYLLAYYACVYAVSLLIRTVLEDYSEICLKGKI
ncbi:hypothetical protein L1987_38390 [Smallanthus sonchifolius]|uniref:Uncharacterized protein n=1 Tax=Smallanthus sonchifolius TaxID=185202 RepID=A0ACB9HJZ1_9ASTR|nr:hypothetical protein L1987_38390 [Smallanthus sonchifolius]